MCINSLICCNLPFGHSFVCMQIYGVPSLAMEYFPLQIIYNGWCKYYVIKYFVANNAFVQYISVHMLIKYWSNILLSLYTNPPYAMLILYFESIFHLLGAQITQSVSWYSVLWRIILTLTFLFWCEAFDS